MKGAPRSRHSGVRWQAFLLAVGAVLGVLVVVVNTWVDHDAALRMTVMVQVAGAAVFTVVAIRRSRRQRGSGWAAIGVFGAAWFVNRLCSLVLASDPSLGTVGGTADVVWVVGIPAGLFGIYRQSFGAIHGRTRRRVLSDAMVVALALMFSGWVIFHLVTLGASEPGPSRELVIPAIEILGSCLVLTAAVYQPRRTQLWWCVAALFAAVVADASLAHQAVTGRDLGNLVVMMACILSPILLVGMVLAPDRTTADVDLDGSDPGAGDRDGGDRAFAVTSARRDFLYLPAAVALVAGFWEVWSDGGMFGLSAILGVTLAVAVVINHRLVSTEAFGLLHDLRSSKRMYQATFDDAPVGIVIADRSGVILRANPAVSEIIGVSVDDIVGRTGDHLLSPTARSDRRRMRDETLSGHMARYTMETEVARPDGGARWTRTTVSRLDQHGEVALIGVVEDVTERRSVQERLEYLAEHDELTGLANRHLLGRRLAVAVEDATETRPAAVLLVDMDQFKLVNDSVGHASGDRLLVECAGRIVVAVGDHGLVTRFGGDEFCVVLDPAPALAHTAVCAQVIHDVQGVVKLQGGDTYPTVSIGAVLTRPGAGAEQLVAEADAALYRAKERGRNRVEWFGPAEVSRARSDLQLLGELNRAIERSELRVYHQPVIDIVTGRTVGTEALVRWQHPDLGLLAPKAFLPMAETAGLIPAIGRYVLAEACATAASWPTIPGHPSPLSVAVNLAVAQLLEADFVDQVAAVLSETGLDPRRLWLEITESALMSDVRATGRTLLGLRNLGVHLSVDDFGTGYSSLTYLKRFPVEALKVDRSFVEGLGIDDDDTTIVSALVGLGRRLGLAVVAEGVETPLQLQVLSDLHCDFAQGYLFSRPVPADVFAASFTELAIDADLGQPVAAQVAAAQPAAADPSKATGSPGLG